MAAITDGTPTVPVRRPGREASPRQSGAVPACAGEGTRILGASHLATARPRRVIVPEPVGAPPHAANAALLTAASSCNLGTEGPSPMFPGYNLDVDDAMHLLLFGGTLHALVSAKQAQSAFCWMIGRPVTVSQVTGFTFDNGNESKPCCPRQREA